MSDDVQMAITNGVQFTTPFSFPITRLGTKRDDVVVLDPLPQSKLWLVSTLEVTPAPDDHIVWRTFDNTAGYVTTIDR
jgi:hypothetical protein